MKLSCRDTRAWLATKDSEVAPVYLAHLATCADCARVAEAYIRFVHEAAEEASADVDSIGESLFVQRVEAGGEYEAFVGEATEQLSSDISEASLEDFILAAQRVHHDESSKSGGIQPSHGPTRAWAQIAIALSVAAMFMLFVFGGGQWLSGVQKLNPVTQRDDVVLGARDVWSLPTSRVVSEAEPQWLVGPGGLRVNVRPGSYVDVVRWAADDVFMQLKVGSVDVALDRHERFVVETGSARVTVVGTEFTVSWSDERGTTVDVREGTVRVDTLEGVLVGLVTAGESISVPAVTDAASGQPPVDLVPTVVDRDDSEAMIRVTDLRTTVKPQTVDPAPAVQVAYDTAPKAATIDTPTDSANADDAIRLLADGQVDEALAVLNKGGARGWRRALLEGDAHHLLGRYVQAEAAYRRAMREGAPASMALPELARLQAGPMNDSEQAVQTWRAYLTLYADGLASAEARLYVAEHGSDDTQEILSPVLTMGSPQERERALALLCIDMIANERWDATRELLAPYVTRTDSMGELALVGLLRVAIADGDVQTSRLLFESYAERFPNGARRHEVQHLSTAISRRK